MISFSNAPGNLFTAWGRLGKLVSVMRTYQLAQLINLTDTTVGAVAQFDAESDIQALVGSAYIGQLGAPEPVGSLAQQVASAYVNRVVYRDSPRLNQTLTSGNTLASIREVIRQMGLAGATVRAQNIGLTPTAFTGTGNGVVVGSSVRPIDGRTLENAYAENLLFTVTADSYVSGATAGNERLAVTGVGAVSDVFAFDWPGGSNCSVNVSAINGAANVAQGNLLTNSGFDAWTGNTPDSWEVVLGASTISKESSLTFGGAASLKLTGNGATLTQIRQEVTVSPWSQYAFNLFLRRDGTAAGSGSLVIDLADVNGAVLQDAAGNNNTFTINLTGSGSLTTSYAAYNVAFRTPEILPAATYLRIRLATPLTSGRSVYLDLGGMGGMTQTYVGGPFVAVFSGAVPFTLGDYATMAVTNSRGAGGTLDTFQTLLFRLLSDGPTNEILWPSSSVPTLSDTLITA